MGFPKADLLLHEDSTAFTMLAKNPVDNKKQKHIHVRYNFVRDHLLKNVYDLAYIPTKSQLA